MDEKQVSLVTTGGTSNSFATLATNQVAGAVLSPPFDDKAVSFGYKKFLFLGDLADIPYVGLFTSQSEIRNSRDRIRKLYRRCWTRSHGSAPTALETIKIIAARFKISANEAEHSYETIIGILSPDGAMDLKKCAAT